MKSSKKEKGSDKPSKWHIKNKRHQNHRGKTQSKHFALTGESAGGIRFGRGDRKRESDVGDDYEHKGNFSKRPILDNREKYENVGDLFYDREEVQSDEEFVEGRLKEMNLSEEKLLENPIDVKERREKMKYVLKKKRKHERWIQRKVDQLGIQMSDFSFGNMLILKEWEKEWFLKDFASVDEIQKENDFLLDCGNMFSVDVDGLCKEMNDYSIEERLNLSKEVKNLEPLMCVSSFKNKEKNLVNDLNKEFDNMKKEIIEKESQNKESQTEQENIETKKDVSRSVSPAQTQQQETSKIVEENHEFLDTLLDDVETATSEDSRNEIQNKVQKEKPKEEDELQDWLDDII